MHIRPTIPTAAALTRRREADIEAASAAMCLAHAAAEAFTALLDRHPGDAGDNPEAIHELVDVIAELTERTRAQFGEPREKLAGGLVPRAVLAEIVEDAGSPRVRDFCDAAERLLQIQAKAISAMERGR